MPDEPEILNIQAGSGSRAVTDVGSATGCRRQRTRRGVEPTAYGCVTLRTRTEGVFSMSKPDSLKEIYADEMKDLWSANDQMTRAVETMAGKAHDPKLKQLLENSVTGIAEHRDALKALLGDAGAEVEKEHCQGMAGLVKEALKHAVGRTREW